MLWAFTATWTMLSPLPPMRLRKFERVPILTMLKQYDFLPGRLRHVVDTNHGTVRGFVRSFLAQCEYAVGRLDRHVAPNVQGVSRLVFVCLGNINRSAFAEQVARSLGANSVSIGLSTSTGSPAFHTAVSMAPQFGLDLTQHRATDITDYQFQPNDLLLAMEIRHARKLEAVGIPRKSIAMLGHWSSPHRIHLHDPHTLSDAYFRTCFTLIHSAVGGLVAEMRIGSSPCLTR
jgi:protein-tyrosine phosphatase